MQQKDSILKRYYAVYMAILLAGIVVLGAVFMLQASRYFRDDQFSRMEAPAVSAVNATKNEIVNNDFKYNKTLLRTMYNYMTAGFDDTDLFWVDVNGATLVCTDETVCTHETHIVPDEMLEQAVKSVQGYRRISTIGNMYRQNRYVLIKPVLLDNGTVTSYIVMTATTKALTDFLFNVLRMFGVATMVVIFVAAIIIYTMTTRLVAPLRAMAESAKSFGQGDFSNTIAITSDDEIGQLGQALNNMAASLSVLESTRRSFVANVSHELKTPMTTISGFVDGILDGTIPPDKQQYYLQIVSDEVKRLSRLVNGMLNVSRIEEGKMTLNPVKFNIQETVIDCLLSFERKLEEKKIEIEGLDVDKIMVEADPDMIPQVVYNLLDNAVKFVNEGGTISFGFEQNQNMVFVSVKNTGEGIPKEQLQMVFERFYKTDRSRGIDTKGVGLGLYIVRTIVMRHGGEISVSSKEGEYTEFCFSIPKAKAQAAKTIRLPGTKTKSEE